MANKYVALLLVCLVIVAGVEAKDLAERQKECYSYCWHACFYPAIFCNWWCTTMCKYPIDFNDGLHGAKQFPVPTEEDYKNRPAGLAPESSKTNPFPPKAGYYDIDLPHDSKSQGILMN